MSAKKAWKVERRTVKRRAKFQAGMHVLCGDVHLIFKIESDRVAAAMFSGLGDNRYWL